MKIINDVKKLELPTNPNIISTKELVFFYELMKSRCSITGHVGRFHSRDGNKNPKKNSKSCPNLFSY